MKFLYIIFWVLFFILFGFALGADYKHSKISLEQCTYICAEQFEKMNC